MFVMKGGDKLNQLFWFKITFVIQSNSDHITHKIRLVFRAKCIFNIFLCRFGVIEWRILVKGLFQQCASNCEYGINQLRYQQESGSYEVWDERVFQAWVDCWEFSWNWWPICGTISLKNPARTLLPCLLWCPVKDFPDNVLTSRCQASRTTFKIAMLKSNKFKVL